MLTNAICQSGLIKIYLNENGKKPYHYSTDLFDLFGDQIQLAKEIMFKPFHLIDMQKISDEELKNRQWVGLIELAMKHIFARDLMNLIEEVMLPLVKQFERQGEKLYVTNLLKYLMSAGNINNKIDT